jgi:hypothetical protein
VRREKKKEEEDAVFFRGAVPSLYHWTLAHSLSICGHIRIKNGAAQDSEEGNEDG